MHTAILPIAGICGTRLPVIAVSGHANANAGDTLVTLGTWIAVIAAPLGEGESAFPVVDLADAHSTWIGILAVLWNADAVATDADIAEGTDIAVITGKVVGREEAAGLGLTSFQSAGIEVVTANHARRDAEARSAVVACSARIAIIAGRILG